LFLQKRLLSKEQFDKNTSDGEMQIKLSFARHANPKRKSHVSARAARLFLFLFHFFSLFL
jgi:hypothetical protein